MYEAVAQQQARLPDPEVQFQVGEFVISARGPSRNDGISQGRGCREAEMRDSADDSHWPAVCLPLSELPCSH